VPSQRFELAKGYSDFRINAHPLAFSGTQGLQKKPECSLLSHFRIRVQNSTAAIKLPISTHFPLNKIFTD
jgi:hypothetical protein